MRLISIIGLLFFCLSCYKKDEFKPSSPINYSVEAAIDANLGTYLTSGSYNGQALDSVILNIVKIDASTISLSSPNTPTITTTINNLTIYEDYASPGGTGLDIISYSNGVEFSIVSGNLLLKYQNIAAKIQLSGKKN
jgi:hypothetical protein